MPKTKVLKFLPYFVYALMLVAAAELGPLPDSQKNPAPAQTALAEAGQPQVLGESTTTIPAVRGDAPVPTTTPQTAPISEPDTSAISAKSFLVFDLATGQNLLEKNGSTKLHIASLTKLMTALVAYNSDDLNQSFTIGPKDTFDVAPVLGLRQGDSVSALDIFNAMLIGSNNDAALALADFTASSTGRDFVDLMNRQAQTLGMADSNFSNPLGFDNGDNYSTAEDLKILISATEKLSAFTDLGRRQSYEFSGQLKNYSTRATNKLLANHPDLQAIKTGYTPYSLGAMATKVNVDGHDIVIIVLGSEDREGDTLRLKDEVFKNLDEK